MQFPINSEMTAAFVCIKPENGEMRPCGTAFFVAHANTISSQPLVKTYVVTARHVLDGIRDKTALDRVFITYNGPHGRDQTEIAMTDWHFHPNADSEYIDVAIARFEYPKTPFKMPTLMNPNYIRCWMTTMLCGTTRAKGEGIHAGHEIGITGLFIHSYGNNRNIPIVRTGNIAAIPNEPVHTKKGPIKAFLIEVRSVAGLSGSPVFTLTGENQIQLLGLIHGHFDQRIGDIDMVAEDESTNMQEEKVNSGIAIVVPAEFIRETLNPLLKEDFYSAIVL